MSVDTAHGISPTPATASSLKRLQASASVEAVVSALYADGVVVIEDLIGESLLAAFTRELEPYLQRTPLGEGGFIGGQTQRCGALFAKARSSADLVQVPPLLEAVERILSVERRVGSTHRPVIFKPNVQISTTQAIRILPGQPAQPLHRDDSVHHNLHPGPEVELNTMYAISDFTRENGATRVIPGSHLWDDDRAPTEADTVTAEMRRGSVLMWLGSVWHGGGENRTREPRTGVVFGYTQGHLRQEENQYLVVPLETVRQYPPRIRDLLGYRVQLPGCGVVEGQDCAVVLERDDWTLLPAKNLGAPPVV